VILLHVSAKYFTIFEHSFTKAAKISMDVTIRVKLNECSSEYTK